MKKTPVPPSQYKKCSIIVKNKIQQYFNMRKIHHHFTFHIILCSRRVIFIVSACTLLADERTDTPSVEKRYLSRARSSKENYRLI